ncbi:gamete expressed protein 1 [Quillaja saponaria]|uniref:Gamete expressed protein 1 n=1 Tax=Quillaja saponaria TaxID=32244 RepID=A0AAD7LUT2_QUISA|nr:gamete expressed protein 1 [Quillaja saponaria]
MEGLNNQKGIKLVENAKNKLGGSNSGWQNANQLLFAGCWEILAVGEKRSRLACWKLLDGQSIALKGLESLSKFQSEALEDSRVTLLHLVEYDHKQQEGLIQRQEQLQQVHDRLMENSKSILAAQESFELKQANMFVALDKLYALHNAMWLESRLIKAFIIYFISIFAIYMFTSKKQTYNGLVPAFFVLVGDNIEPTKMDDKSS